MSTLTSSSAVAAAARSIDVPKKLRDDAIVEAVCQLQFQATEVAEVTVGRLSDDPVWREFHAVRLPVADIPLPVRQADPNLKAQPILELRRKDGARVVRIGENVISYHIVGVRMYCGWTAFRAELERVFSLVCTKLSSPKITRLGFRYINAVTPGRHHIEDVQQLNLDVRVGGSKLQGPINLNYVTNDGESHVTTTRIAHRSFVQGPLPSDANVIIDVEVANPPNRTVSSLKELLAWVEDAHTFEKRAFFQLFPAEIIEKLREE